MVVCSRLWVWLVVLNYDVSLCNWFGLVKLLFVVWVSVRLVVWCRCSVLCLLLV